jgi:hypothetical protein
MSPVWVVLAYGSSVLLAMLLLYVFHSRAWYWHLMSAGLAIALGLVPLPAEWAGPQTDLLVGFLFLLLLVWGLAAPLFRLKLPGR